MAMAFFLVTTPFEKTFATDKNFGSLGSSMVVTAEGINQQRIKNGLGPLKKFELDPIIKTINENFENQQKNKKHSSINKHKKHSNAQPNELGQSMLIAKHEEEETKEPESITNRQRELFGRIVEVDKNNNVNIEHLFGEDIESSEDEDVKNHIDDKTKALTEKSHQKYDNTHDLKADKDDLDGLEVTVYNSKPDRYGEKMTQEEFESKLDALRHKPHSKQK